MKLIGLTGGIGSGKSAVTAYLRSCGEVVICADETAKAVAEPGQRGNIVLREHYGDGFFLPDGRLDRKLMAAHVFGNAERVAQLNALLHPSIIATMFEQARLHSSRVFLDAALLIQSGMHKQVDAVWLVVAEMETRIVRVMQRDAASREQVLRRIENQLSDDEMKPFADAVIENNGTLEELHTRVGILLKESKFLR